MFKIKILLLCFFPTILFAQHNNQAGIKFYYGSILIHTPSVKNLQGSKPSGIEIELSRQPMDTPAFNKCNCFPRNGLTLSYFDFDTKILGSSIMLSYFIEPSFRLSNKMQFNLRGAAGLTYASSPYNVNTHPENRSYTTNVNPYLQVGLGLGYNLNTHLRMSAIASLQHFSNGAYREPNRGVNWVTGSVGLLYFSKNTFLPAYSHVSAKGVINKKIKIDGGILFVPGQGYNSKSMAKSKLIAGLFMQATKQYGRISAVTGGIETYYNKLQAQSGEISNWITGVHVGHAFILGRVAFSQQIGYDIYSKLKDADKFYFRYGLLYRFTNHLLGGINLKAHQDNADFADFRLMYRF